MDNSSNRINKTINIAGMLGVEIEFDPLGQWREHKFVETKRFNQFEKYQIVFRWAVDSTAQSKRFIDLLPEYYQMGLYPFEDSIVDKDGLRSYPGDPDQLPIFKVSIKSKGETIWIYDYEIIAIRDEKETLVVRVD
jgi:hypothetical protein